MEKNNTKVRAPKLYVQFYCQLPGWLRANFSHFLNLFAKMNMNYLFTLYISPSSGFVGVKRFCLFLKTFFVSFSEWSVNHNLIMKYSNQFFSLNIQINGSSTYAC